MIENTKMESMLTKKLRGMMKGKAVDYMNGEEPRAWSAKRVWQYWRLAPTAVELLVRRLREWQKIVSDPSNYQQFLVIFFGRLRLETEAEEKGWKFLPAPIAEDGKMNLEAHTCG